MLRELYDSFVVDFEYIVAILIFYLSPAYLPLILQRSSDEVSIRFRSGSDEIPMEIGGNQRANHGQNQGLQSTIPDLELKVIKQKVSIIKNSTIQMLLFKPKIGAKLIYFYGICKFLRAYTRIYKGVICFS